MVPDPSGPSFPHLLKGGLELDQDRLFFLVLTSWVSLASVAQLVEASSYTPKGSRFDPWSGTYLVADLSLSLSPQ